MTGTLEEVRAFWLKQRQNGLCSPQPRHTRAARHWARLCPPGKHEAQNVVKKQTPAVHLPPHHSKNSNAGSEGLRMPKLTSRTLAIGNVVNRPGKEMFTRETKRWSPPCR